MSAKNSEPAAQHQDSAAMLRSAIFHWASREEKKDPQRRTLSPL